MFEERVPLGGHTKLLGNLDPLFKLGLMTISLSPTKLDLWFFGILVYGCVWVELSGFFNPTYHGGLKKFNPTQPITGIQPNPRGSGWTHGLDNFFKLLLLLLN